MPLQQNTQSLNGGHRRNLESILDQLCVVNLPDEIVHKPNNGCQAAVDAWQIERVENSLCRI
jgi:hypothetical protein